MVWWIRRSCKGTRGPQVRATLGAENFRDKNPHRGIYVSTTKEASHKAEELDDPGRNESLGLLLKKLKRWQHEDIQNGEGAESQRGGRSAWVTALSKGALVGKEKAGPPSQPDWD